jgi:aryl-alcohol dehydrogenase-like predicted oxidoreductase
MAHDTITVGDLRVNRLGFGAMRVCGPNVWGPPKEDRAGAHKVLRRAFELGCNFFDTADSYGPHVDEEMIAEALHPYPEGLVIATKGGLLRPRPGAWDPDGRPEHLKRALDGSLKRLRLERIDVYQLHAPDPKVPFADSVGALADAQKAGKIRHVGISNVSLQQLEQARRICPIVSVQNEYNLADRSSEDVLKACERLGIAFLPWYPLGAGAVLKQDKVKSIAKKLHATAAQVAISWLLRKSPAMLPIPGTSSLEHLQKNCAAADLQLSDADFAALS